MVAFCLVIMLLGAAEPQSESRVEDVRTLYYQALKESREGRIEEALKGFERILKTHPGDPFADDALMEQARITEEILGKPARALELYRKLLGDYPDSRLVRRARSRSEFISGHLDRGEAVLNEYQAILRRSPQTPALQAVVQLEGLLEREPEFSLRPDGLAWMGSVLAGEGQTDRALEKWNQVVESYPEHAAAGRALIGMGNLAMQAGDLAGAERSFMMLSGMPGEKWRQAARESLGRLERLRNLRRVFFAALATWMAVLLALWIGLASLIIKRRVAPRRLLRPPLELVIFLVVMAGLVIWAATGTRQTTRVLLWLSGMLGLLILPNGWSLGCFAPRGAKLWLWILMLVTGCLAAAVVSVEMAGMTNQVLHTLKWGPA